MPKTSDVGICTGCINYAAGKCPLLLSVREISAEPVTACTDFTPPSPPPAAPEQEPNA